MFSWVGSSFQWFTNNLTFSPLFCLGVMCLPVTVPIISIAKMLGLVKVSLKHSNLAGKIAIVTGIGKSTAKQLATMGATVIMACRSLERGHAAAKDITNDLKKCTNDPTYYAGGSVVVMELDVSDLRSVKAFAKSFQATYKKLDILVNNAGISPIQGPTSSIKRTPQGLESVFATNFIGPAVLTLELLDLLKTSPSGRIVNLSSILHRFASHDIALAAAGADELRPYENSKLAMVLFTCELRRRLAGTPAVATAVDPGFVASDIWRFFGETPVLLAAFRAFCRLAALTTDQGAAVSVAAALSDGDGGAELYLQPYWLPGGLAIPFELVGPFLGARAGRARLPPDEPRQSRDIWRRCEQLAAAAAPG